MKKIDSSLFSNYYLTIASFISSSFVVSYGLFNYISNFYFLWFFILLLLIFIASVFSFLHKNIEQKKLQDLEAIKVYLEEISSKNYKAEVKVENYYEFLYISIILKNIVKRLVKQEIKKNRKDIEKK